MTSQVFEKLVLFVQRGWRRLPCAASCEWGPPALAPQTFWGRLLRSGRLFSHLAYASQRNLPDQVGRSLLPHQTLYPPHLPHQCAAGDAGACVGQVRPPIPTRGGGSAFHYLAASIHSIITHCSLTAHSPQIVSPDALRPQTDSSVDDEPASRPDVVTSTTSTATSGKPKAMRAT